MPKRKQLPFPLPDTTGKGVDALVQQTATDTLNALEEVMNCLVACAVPGPGCGDKKIYDRAVERGEAALAAAGRLLVREPE